MAESDIVKASDVNVAPFLFDFGSEFIRENLPAEKRTELALVAQNGESILLRMSPSGRFGCRRVALIWIRHFTRRMNFRG